jgi:hypothetical protein
MTSPLAAVRRVAVETLEGRSTLDPWRSGMRASLRPVDARVLAPMLTLKLGRWTLIPDCLSPPPSFGMSFDDELDRVAETAPDTLRSDLAAIAPDGDELRGWSAALRDPARWLTAYVIAMRRGWAGICGLWNRALPLFDRELERVGTASVRGAVPELLATLQPDWPVDDTGWWLPPTTMARLHIPTDGLVLVPLLPGPKARGLWEAGGGDVVTHVGYPLPGGHRLFNRPAGNGHHNGNGNGNGSSLDALIGEQRARILRRLDRPASAGALAETIVATPSAATHHIDALERAGLANRERRGRRVMVRRTARGTALLGLYE